MGQSPPPMPSNCDPTIFSRSMADYYSILASAVRGLDPNTSVARRRLYGRARSALISEMQNAEPPIPRSEIMVAQMALEAAIEELEADAGPEPVNAARGEFEEHGRPLASRVSVAPSRPANQDIDRRGSRARIWTLFRWRSSDNIDVRERGTWLTDLLERASDEEEDEFQDFGPKWARRRSG
jgi:hypothetical protein